MRCPSCNHDNRAERRFCAECGAALAVRCAACGVSNEPGEKFCGACGTQITGLGVKGLAARGKTEPLTPNPVTASPLSYTPKHLADRILTSRSALEGERKQVTVLFADVKGSMELAEQLDPEEWHTILDRFFAILTDGVQDVTDAAQRGKRLGASFPSLRSVFSDLQRTSRRYERRPVILTTNLAFSAWSTVFPNAACATALIDRLTHHTEIIAIEGESYRRREAEERKKKRREGRK